MLGAVPDGTHTYAARAIDAATNTSARDQPHRHRRHRAARHDDHRRPERTRQRRPRRRSRSRPRPNATFECSVDGVAHTACPNPFTTPTLSQGPHTLSVRAVDAAGNRDNTPRPAPSPSTLAPAAPRSPRPRTARCWHATVKLSGTAEPTRRSRSSRARRRAARRRRPRRRLVASSPRCRRHAHVHGDRRDAATNVSGARRPDGERRHGRARRPGITAGPSGPVNTASPQFTFTGEPGATFECALDNADFEPCTSPKPTRPHRGQPHVPRAADRRRRQRRRDAVRAFSVDLTPPAQPAVVSGPEGATTNVAGFDFTSDAGTIVECRLDGPGGPGSFAAVRVAAELQRPGAGRLHVPRALDRRGGQPAHDLALVHDHDRPGRADARRRRRHRPDARADAGAAADRRGRARERHRAGEA